MTLTKQLENQTRVNKELSQENEALREKVGELKELRDELLLRFDQSQARVVDENSYFRDLVENLVLPTDKIALRLKHQRRLMQIDLERQREDRRRWQAQEIPVLKK